MVTREDLDQVAELLAKLYEWAGISNNTPPDTVILDTGIDGITVEQLESAMKTINDIKVESVVGAGTVKITK